jgi:hypothetical protein
MACVLSEHCGEGNKVVLRVTVNLLRAFALGPSGFRHPSVSNVDRFGMSLRAPLKP